jgi:hypothetical protein
LRLERQEFPVVLVNGFLLLLLVERERERERELGQGVYVRSVPLEVEQEFVVKPFLGINGEWR